MKLKRYAALLLALALLAGCKAKTPDPTPTPDSTPTAEDTTPPEPTASPSLEHDEKVRGGMLKGATGLGCAKLMADKADSTAVEFTLMAEATEAVAALTKGEVDIAALPTNLAATLYHKLDGGIQLLALNTYGVLYILERGNSLESLGDLSGKTVHAFGQGANPEFVLNYLLTENGLTAGEDVTVQWHSSTDEVSTLLAAGEIDCAMLPVPAATAATVQG
ncbi:MAG: PhnD/SsuA/transferrin family substrate-binding protein, partial [Oscillospiraceae bacterium]|nr:PhnD/SsuA/transferrin family substrate-binding protein [Oscillospiraceae bacterium]